MRLLAAALALLASPAFAVTPALPKPVVVVIETDLGNLEAELDVAHARVTASNFLRYVDAGRYTDGRFHRTVSLDNQPQNKVKIEVVQAGMAERFAEQDFPAIPLERTSQTGLSHLDGTLSMARDGPDSATSDFFVCLGAQPELDFGGKRNADGQGFAAFGRVTRGLGVLRRIQAAPRSGQTLAPPVRILRIRRASNAPDAVR